MRPRAPQFTEREMNSFFGLPGYHRKAAQQLVLAGAIEDDIIVIGILRPVRSDSWEGPIIASGSSVRLKAIELRG
ncbi:hypothetical protein A3858_03145 [Cereibacter sphaeroides]|nr:hypothetical protein A3858_03145 [Cereibacter sphaeroides]